MIVFSILLSSIYVILIIYFWTGWHRIPIREDKTVTSNKDVTVIICAHNEGKNLPNLISLLRNQSYSHFEVILMNDHSSDHTEEIMKSTTTDKRFSYYNSIGRGKKNALIEAVSHCQTELIIQTDADCIPGEKWIEQIVSYQNESNCDLLLLPVKMDGSNFFQKLQSIEFLSLISSGAGAAGMNNPLMCNAANMAYTRQTFLECQANIQNDFCSGDDMFLLLTAKRKRKKILFLKSSSVIISTEAAPTLSKFIHQRKRWASKSSGYRDPFVITTALTVGLISLGILFLLLSGNWNALMICFFSKLCIDFLFLYDTANFFNLRKDLTTIPLIAIIYPFYIVFCGIGGLFSNKKEW